LEQKSVAVSDEIILDAVVTMLVLSESEKVALALSINSTTEETHVRIILTIHHELLLVFALLLVLGWGQEGVAPIAISFVDPGNSTNP